MNIEKLDFLVSQSTDTPGRGREPYPAAYPAAHIDVAASG